MTSPTAQNPPVIGERLRAVRTERGISIRELANLAGVSSGLISQVERGINNPSLQTLRALAKALETPLFDLFQQSDSDDIAVVRAGDRMSIRSPQGNLTYERISPGYGRLEMLSGELRPGGCSSVEPWSHPSEECVVVTRGRLVVQVGDTAHELRVGDSCYFDSRIPHRYVNESRGLVTFTLAVTPPSY